MDGFEIRASNSKKGRGLFATKKYEEEDIILEENPFMSCQFAWNAAYKYLACEFCLRPLETPEDNVRRLAAKPDIMLPHPNCVQSYQEKIVSCDGCGVQYCSTVCRLEAQCKYHQLLCHHPSDIKHPIAVLLETWKQMHYPPETTNIMLLIRILAYVKLTTETDGINLLKEYCHRTVNEDAELVHKLLGEQFSCQLNTLRELTSNVIFGDVVNEFLTPEGFLSLVALVGTNGQGIGTSPLSMWVNAVSDLTMSDDERKQLNIFIDKIYQNVEEESGTFLNTEGSGLYKLQSACNHSCDPNAEVSFPYGNHRLQLKATKPIMPGEEVHISYLDDCTLQRSRHSRQKELAQNYLFVCSCERCLEQASEPNCTSEEEMSDNDMSDADD